MTPEEFRDCLYVLPLRESWLMQMLDVDQRRFRRWKSGERKVPVNVELWLRRLAQQMDENPPPDLRGQAREA